MHATTTAAFLISTLYPTVGGTRATPAATEGCPVVPQLLFPRPPVQVTAFWAGNGPMPAKR